MSTRVGMEPEVLYDKNTYASQVEYLRDFVLRRWTWIDTTLNSEA